MEMHSQEESSATACVGTYIEYNLGKNIKYLLEAFAVFWYLN